MSSLSTRFSDSCNAPWQAWPQILIKNRDRELKDKTDIAWNLEHKSCTLHRMYAVYGGIVLVGCRVRVEAVFISPERSWCWCLLFCVFCESELDTFPSSLGLVSSCLQSLKIYDFKSGAQITKLQERVLQQSKDCVVHTAPAKCSNSVTLGLILSAFCCSYLCESWIFSCICGMQIQLQENIALDRKWDDRVQQKEEGCRSIFFSDKSKVKFVEVFEIVVLLLFFVLDCIILHVRFSSHLV